MLRDRKFLSMIRLSASRWHSTTISPPSVPAKLHEEEPQQRPPFKTMSAFSNAGMDTLIQFVNKPPETLFYDASRVQDADINMLPFVNREVALLTGARALLSTQQDILLGADSRSLKLLFCAQLFGAGKTTYARRLFAALCHLFGEEHCHYSVSLGLPSGSPDCITAVKMLLIRGAERANICELGSSYYREEYSFESVVDLFQSRLAENEKRGVGVSQLFLHFDEFDLSSSDFSPRYFPGIPDVPAAPPASSTEAEKIAQIRLQRYDRVWKDAFVPLLSAPNIHVIVTGRPIELAILGTRSLQPHPILLQGVSPTLATHAVLGLLQEEHIMEILLHLHVQLRPTDEFKSAFDALGLQSEDERKDLAKKLQLLTGGVPRFLCLAIARVLQMKSHGQEAINLETVCSNMLQSSEHIRTSIKQIRDLIMLSPNADVFKDLLEFSELVFSRREVDMYSQDGARLIFLCNRFCAYVDKSADGKHIKAVMPTVLAEGLLRLPAPSAVSRQEVDWMNLCEVFRGDSSAFSAGALGDRMEENFRIALRIWWLLSVRQQTTGGGWIPQLAALFHGTVVENLVPDLSKPVDVIALGKLLPNLLNEKNESAQTVVSVVAREMAVERMRGRNIRFEFAAASHSADSMMSIAFSPQSSWLVGFGIKNSSSKSTPAQKIRDSIGAFGATVAALSAKQREFYTHRVFVIIAHPNGAHPGWHARDESSVQVKEAKGNKKKRRQKHVDVVDRKRLPLSDPVVRWCCGRPDGTLEWSINDSELDMREPHFQVVEVADNARADFLNVPTASSLLHQLWSHLK